MPKEVRYGYKVRNKTRVFLNCDRQADAVVSSKGATLVRVGHPWMRPIVISLFVDLAVCWRRCNLPGAAEAWSKVFFQDAMRPSLTYGNF